MVASIKVTGLVQTITALQAVGAAGAACNGPLATIGSTLPYAYGIEEGRTRGGRLARRAGGAHMIKMGAAAALEEASQRLPGAIPRGPAAVGAAKRQIRDKGVSVAQANTPVRSGRLRSSIQELNRGGGI